MVHGKCSKQQNFQSIQAHVPQYYTCGNYLFNELILPRDIEILGWCSAGPVLPHGEKVPL